MSWDTSNCPTPLSQPSSIAITSIWGGWDTYGIYTRENAGESNRLQPVALVNFKTAQASFVQGDSSLPYELERNP